MHASIEVAGVLILARMSIWPKSVCVSSSEGGPRSCVAGGLDLDTGGDDRYEEVDMARVDEGSLQGFREEQRRPFDDHDEWWAALESIGCLEIAERRARRS